MKESQLILMNKVMICHLKTRHWGLDIEGHMHSNVCKSNQCSGVNWLYSYVRTSITKLLNIKVQIMNIYIYIYIYIF